MSWLASNAGLANLPTNLGAWIKSFIRSVFGSLYGSIVGVIGGAILTTLVFFLTSHDPRELSDVNRMRAEASEAILKTGLARQGSVIHFEFVDSFKLSFASDVVVMHGKFDSAENLEPDKPDKRDKIDPAKPPPSFVIGINNEKFVSIFEQGHKTLIDQVVGRDAPKKLSYLIMIDGVNDDDMQPSNIEIEDLYHSGQKALLFDLVSTYGDGTSISPVVIQKQEGAWHLTTLPSFSQEADVLMTTLLKEKKIKATKNGEPNTVFSDDYTAHVSGVEHKFVTLRTGGYYKYFDHPQYGYKQLLIAASYYDDCVQCKHRVFAKVMRLNEGAWTADENWNGGNPIASGDAIDLSEQDLDKLYQMGSKRTGSIYFWHYSFSKDVRSRKKDARSKK